MVLKQPKYEIFFFSALLLHILILFALILNFEFSQPPPVLQNANQIIEASVLFPPKTPSKVIQKMVPVSPPPTVAEVEKTKPKFSPPATTNAMVLPDKSKKANDIQKKMLADLRQQKELQKKQQKAIEMAMRREVKLMHEKLLQEKLLEEERQLQNVRAAQMQGVVDKYKALILHAISQHWLVPPEVNKKLSAQLMIRLAPGGVVLDVQLIKSSGDQVLDHSARTAVFKSSPLPVPTDRKEFEAFREFVLKVKPENIVALSS